MKVVKTTTTVERREQIQIKFALGTFPPDFSLTTVAHT